MKPIQTVLPALLDRIATGDSEAFARFYDLTCDRVYGMVLRVLRDPGFSEETTQEVFLQVWRSARSFDPNAGSALSWLITLAHRRAVDRVRSESAASRRDVNYGLAGIPSTFDEVTGLPLVTRNGHELNAEAILALEPTVVLTDTSLGPWNVVLQLREAGVPVVVVDAERSLDNVGVLTEQVADALGVPAAGDALAARLAEQVDGAVADAEAVAELLRSEYGFAEITLLRNAKQREIVRAFNRLAQTAQENDSVLIYYAGHGHLNEGTKEGFWIPVNAEGRDDSTFVSNAIIKTKLGVIADRARHVLLVSDSCFSGALLREGNRGVSLSDRNERYYQKVSKKKSVQILAAGGLEFVDDNYKGAGHSPFTYYLLQSLKDNNARFFEASDLSRETSRNVSINTVQTPESGVLQGAGHAGGEFFFLKTSDPDPEPKRKAPASEQKQIVKAQEFRADEEAWKTLMDSDDPEDFRFFLEEFPESALAKTAKFKLRRLERKQAKAEQERIAKQEEERKRQEAEQRRIAEANVREAYESAKRKNTAEAYRTFLSQFRNDDAAWHYVGRAERQLKQLDDVGIRKDGVTTLSSSGSASRATKRQAYLDYLEAKGANTATALRQFIGKYSNTSEAKSYVERAQKELNFFDQQNRKVYS